MASRFWVAQPVSGAIVSPSTPPLVRLTVSSTTGMTTGDTRTVYGIVGTTEANGTWTITVIDGTHIDLQGTTFSNLYTSGGLINGRWDATNTNNWVSTTGGTNYGQTVPTSTDDVTLDGSSGGGTIVINTNFNITGLTSGAHTGILDFSVNNNSPTFNSNGWSLTGSATRTITLGSGTFSFTGTGSNALICTNSSNLTVSANTATFSFSGNSASGRTVGFGSTTITNWPAIVIGANSHATPGSWTIGFNSSATIPSLTVTAPNYLAFANSNTLTVTAALTLTGTSSTPLFLTTNSIDVPATIASSNASTLTWAAIRGITFPSSSTASNSFDLKRNTNITITSPTGGSTGVIGG